jgi:hypothetical protein
MRYQIIFLLLISLLVSSASGQNRRNYRPKVEKPRKEIVEAPKASLGAIVEKYVSNYEINADGTALESVETQKRCTTNSCIELFSPFKHVYNNDLQKMKVTDAYLVKADGKIIKIPASDITDRPTAQAEAAPGFSSLREVEIKFSNWEAGDAAYVKIESQTTKATLEGRYDTLEIYPALFEWKSIEVNASAPVGYKLYVDAFGLEGGKLPDENGRARWRYKRTNVPLIDIEPVGNPFPVSPRFALTTFRDPAELGSAFWEILKEKTAVTPEIQKLADEITKDAKTPAEQAAAIYDWTNRNIRYFFIVLDRSGWVPHDASQILRNGYGDCKDYTVLIHTLLKAKGIESTPVLIRSELGSWFPSVPAMDFFNHAILYIPSLKLFADATVPNTRLGLIPQTIVGRKAVLAGEKTGLIEVPKDIPADSQILSDTTMSFAENGSVKAQTRNTYVGRTEILFRPIFGESVIGKNPSTFVKLMLAYFGVEGDGRIVKVGNPHKVGEAFSVEVETGIDDYTTFIPKGKLTLPIGLNMVNIGAMEQFATTDTRATGLEVGAATMRENIIVELPATVRIAVPPKAVELSSSTGKFSLKSEIKENRLHIIREFLILKDTIEPAEYPLFRQFIKSVVDANNVEIEYAADPSLLKAKSREKKKSKPSEAKSPVDRMLEAMGGLALESSLKQAQVRSLEAKLVANQNDVESRKTLLQHYGHYQTKQTPVVEAALLQHRLWFIKNRPELGDAEIFGWWPPALSQKTQTSIRDAWLAAVEKSKDDATVRLNAIDYMMARSFNTEAEKMIGEGIATAPSNYKYPLLMTELITRQVKKDTPEAEKKVLGTKVLGYGKTALSLIKKERSMERDRDRRELLKSIASAAIAADELDLAAAFATELILDFGQSADEPDYDNVTHIGNVALGRVELRKGNIDKAKEYLLVSMRAPLRQPTNYLIKIDTRLARELYDKGVKNEVLEFLTLGLELNHLKTDPKLYEDEISAIKLWQEKIKQGVKPSFDFDNP